MNELGRVEAIHIAPAAGEDVEGVERVEAEAGTGLRGDRYYEAEGTFSENGGPGRHLTLIEAEAVEAIEREADISFEPGEHRRNVTTRDVALNHLVGEEFTVGDVRCVGTELCEPCSHLQSLTEEGVLNALVHRGGLRADVIESGTIGVGDAVGRD